MGAVLAIGFIILLIALLVGLATLLARMARPASFYAAGASRDQVVAALVAQRTIGRLEPVTLQDGSLEIRNKGFNQPDTTVLIEFANDGRGVGVNVRPTHITRQSGMNVSGRFVSTVKRAVEKAVTTTSPVG